MEDEEESVSEEDNRVDLSDDEIGPPGGRDPLLSGARLTSPDVNREVLRRKTVMTPRTLFGDDAMVERVGFRLLVPLSKLDKRRGQSRVVLCLEQSHPH